MLFPDATITALLGKAVGDSFGASFEFHSDAPALSRRSLNEGRYLDCREDCRQPIRRCRTSGLYTDDTQQALVLLWIWSQMVERGKDPLRSDMVAELFLRVCRRMANEKAGPGSFGVHRGTGRNFRDCIVNGAPPDTAGLGAAMRIAPVATLLPKEKVISWAVEVSSATSTNPIALAGAAMVAAAAWDAANDIESGADLDDLGFQNIGTEIQDAWHQLVKGREVLQNRGEDGLLDFAVRSGVASRDLKCAADGFALTGIPWVLHCVRQATSFEDALLRVCSSGGDTDTVGAIAGCLAALRFGRVGIPSWMTDHLIGRDHILDPNVWHPVGTERVFIEMDAKLQAELEHQVREAAKARDIERKKARKEKAP